MKILIADKFPETGVAALEALDCQVTLAPELQDESLAEALGRERPEALVVRSTKVSDTHLDAAPDLALIIRAGAGVNTIDVAAASVLGIYVANCPGKNSIAVAELAFAHMLSMDRRLVDGAVDLQRGVWNKSEYSRARGLYGRILGLVGLGRIGREMVLRARAFGMRVVAWSRSLDEVGAHELGVDWVGTPLAVAQRSDVVSLHVALSDQTRHLVNERFIETMKPGALLINTSRGDVVDTEALAKAVASGRIRAALDVFEGEPAGGRGEVDRALFSHAAIQGSHHIGASTEQAQSAVADEVVRIVRSFVVDGVVPNCVNLAERTQATHLLVVRHRDRVGVLAGILDVLRRAEINVQEVENVIFEGSAAASARIQLAAEPGPETLEAIRTSSGHVLSVTLRRLATGTP